MKRNICTAMSAGGGCRYPRLLVYMPKVGAINASGGVSRDNKAGVEAMYSLCTGYINVVLYIDASLRR